MENKKCELCQKNDVIDMRFGVKLCQNCIDEYHKALSGDTELAKKISNPDNFPHATDMAKKNIIQLISNRMNRIENIAEEKTQQKKVDEKEQKRESYAKSIGVDYKKKSQVFLTIIFFKNLYKILNIHFPLTAFLDRWIHSRRLRCQGQ